MSASDKTEQFVQQLAENQNRLYGYVYSLVGDHAQAADVVQETNMVLWRKLGEFDPQRPFLPWAFAIARFQVLAHIRDRKRDRLLLDEELAQALSVEAERQAGQFEGIRKALRPCLDALTAGNRELIEKKYFRGLSIQAIADAVERSAGSVKVALLRTRRHLAECIEGRLAAEEML